jgi:hypothetical protein
MDDANGTGRFFQMLIYRRILRRLDVGKRVRVANIMLRVWVVRLRAEVLIFLLLMTRIRSRMPYLKRLWNTPTSGTRQDPVSDYNRAGLL